MKRNNLRNLIFSVAMTACVIVSAAACTEESPTISNLPTTDAVMPSGGAVGDVAVHDPSIFYDEEWGKYYAFGTHYAVASSEDLISWRQEVYEPNARALFGTDVATVIPESIRLTGVTGTPDLWAPDVIRLDGTYDMYYSLTSGFGSDRSVIGRVSSDSVLGPYSNEEIVIESCTTTDSSHPNCIDPELFYDKEGKLWMVYGSFFGGIYIKELDDNGMPVSDGWGKLLWLRGNSEGVEGPFIFYNEATDYYYLMVSEGDLSTVYNMRVARSKNPDGPYEDISGSDVTTSRGIGVKLAGNYRFAGGEAKRALGHNSVIEVDGSYYVVCHVRNASGAHHVEVHELFFNVDGWPVMAPNRYGGEVRGLVQADALAGSYDVILHSYATVDTIVESVNYTFGADGTITDAEGASAGSWSLTDNYYVTITLNNVEYKGVAAPGWRENGTQKAIWCMTAVNASGTPLWANAAD